MRNIKILNLYNEALELNGDTMNVTAFTNRLDEMGYGYEISTAGVGEEADFSAFDIVFVCHGYGMCLWLAHTTVVLSATGSRTTFRR